MNQRALGILATGRVAVAGAVLALYLLATLSGCAHPLPASPRLGASDADRCRRIDDDRINSGTWAYAGLAVAGAGGVAAIPLEPIDDREARATTLVVAGAVGVIGAVFGGAFKWRETQRSEQFVRECR